MAKKTHILICQSCLKASNDKGLTKDMFYLVDNETHYSVHCIDCIQKENLKIVRPYFKPRKKKTSK